MPTFEQGFADAEKAADSVLSAIGSISTQARQLRKAAQEGNIAAIRRHSERLQDGLGLVRQEVANAGKAWPFAPEQEQAYLQERYNEELKDEGRTKGLQIIEQDGRLIAHPSVVRVMAGERAVQINRRQSSAIRPTRIVDALRNLQTRKSSFRPNQFLQSLHDAYLILTQGRQRDALKLGELGQVVPLRQIYDLFTGLPGAKREYSLLDFARDIYSLQTSGVREVRGARVSFPASTGTRRATGTISFVGPNGEQVIYYGIQFTGDRR